MQIENIIVIIAYIIAAMCAAVVIILLALNQKKRIIMWLTYAVSEAEKQLGAKTGQYKLRLVYDQFIKAFPKIATVISPETFSRWVDIALRTMRKWIEDGNQIGEYIMNAEEKQKEAEKES
ncbi:MAG: hypothetical protein ACI4F7_07700 [Acutalibacteraceae bacterium]